MGASKHTGGHPNIWGMSEHMEASKHMQSVQTYRGCPNIWGIKTYEVSKHMGHQNIWGCPNI